MSKGAMKMAEVVGYVIGLSITFAVILGSLLLIANAGSNISAGMIGFATAVLMNWIYRKCGGT